MDSNKEFEKLLNKNTSLIDKLYKYLVNNGVDIPKELEAEVKNLTIPDVVLQNEQFSLSDIYKIAQGHTEE